MMPTTVNSPEFINRVLDMWADGQSLDDIIEACRDLRVSRLTRGVIYGVISRGRRNGDLRASFRNPGQRPGLTRKQGGRQVKWCTHPNAEYDSSGAYCPDCGATGTYPGMDK